MRRCRTSGGERPKISPLSGLDILFARVQTILACFQLSNHVRILANQSPPLTEGDRSSFSRQPQLFNMHEHVSGVGINPKSAGFNRLESVTL